MFMYRPVEVEIDEEAMAQIADVFRDNPGVEAYALNRLVERCPAVRKLIDEYGDLIVLRSDL